jgi:signal transduction histidine kinase/ligand-binding sensor domain-containing protein
MSRSYCFGAAELMRVLDLSTFPGKFWCCLRLSAALFALMFSWTGLGAGAFDYSARSWQIEDGLPQNSVTSIVQTPDGYLWLATFNGLARFDGTRFTVYDEGNVPALTSSRLVRLDVDQQGVLWIQTEEGELIRHREGQFRNVTASKGFPAAGAGGIMRGPQGGVLLVDRAGGVHRLQGDGWVADRQYDFLQGNRLSLWVGEDDQLWAWSRDRRTFGRVSAGQVQWLQGPDGQEEVNVRAYAPSVDGGLWLIISNQVWHYNYRLSEWRPTSWLLPESARGLMHLLEDLQGNVWLATYNGGLVRFAPSGAVEQFTADKGITHNAVRTLCHDREGNIWAGTDGGGLNYLRPRLVRMVGVSDGLGAPVVMSIARDQQNTGAVWFGLNGGGINRLENGQFTSLIREPLMSTNSFVYGLLPDKSGGLWIGTYDHGVVRLDNGTVTQIPGSEGWNRKPMLAGLEDRTGAIWLGGSGGLLRWRHGQAVHFDAALVGSNVVVRALAEDRAGNIYVGSSGKGLLRHSMEQWTVYSEEDGLPNNRVTALYVDPEDTLWIGTWHGGVSRFKHGRFFNYSTLDGLPANCIASIVEDDLGYLWFGSNRGIFRVAKSQLDLAAEQGRQILTVNSYGISDGLSTLECGGGAQPAACKAPDGKLWFATVRGVAIVNPAQLIVNRFEPPVIIEEVIIDDKAVVLDQTPALSTHHTDRCAQQSVEVAPRFMKTNSRRSVFVVPPRTHRLELRFAGLSFTAPEKVRFRYRLRGLDAHWIEAGSSRSASYAHLRPGKYQFEVTACNNDGIWNKTGASLGIAVLPPWWLTWWFRVGVVLAAIGIISWPILLRWRQVQHERSVEIAFAQRLIHSQEEERQRIAAELHDSIGQNLLVIKNRALLGLRDIESQARRAEQLEEISKTATQSLEEVREISRNLRPYQIDSLGLTKAISVMVSKVSSASGLRCELELELVDGLLAHSSEIHLYRIIQELLNNVIKHSDASMAWVRLKPQLPSLILTVEDDGRGFDYSAVSGRPAKEHGLGLRDIAERVRILGGTIECDSCPAKGTRWKIEIPAASEAHEKR